VGRVLGVAASRQHDHVTHCGRHGISVWAITPSLGPQRMPPHRSNV
jgi:hypothetical protein